MHPLSGLCGLDKTINIIATGGTVTACRVAIFECLTGRQQRLLAISLRVDIYIAGFLTEKANLAAFRNGSLDIRSCRRDFSAG